jgi:predicted tellurium resistance membrane protein TerC
MKSIRNFHPLFFAVFSLLVYLLIYKPPLDSGSPDFVTACFAFSAALGWGSIICFAKENQPVFFSIYLLLAIGSLIFMSFFFKGFTRPMHLVMIVLVLISLIWLKLFVAAHVRYERKNKGEKYE